MAHWDPPALLLLDAELLTSGHCEFSGSVSHVSGSRLAICIHLDNRFRDPAAFSLLVGTPDPHPGGIVLPGAGSFAHSKSLTSFHSHRVSKRGLIVLRNLACSFGICLRSVHKVLLHADILLL